MNTHIFYKKLVLNFLPNNNRNTIGYCSNNNTEQKKHYETFSAEALVSYKTMCVSTFKFTYKSYFSILRTLFTFETADSTFNRKPSDES